METTGELVPPSPPEDRRAIGRVAALTLLFLVIIWGFFFYRTYISRMDAISFAENSLLHRTKSVQIYTQNLFKMAEIFHVSTERWLAANPSIDPRTDPGFVGLIEAFRKKTGSLVDIRMAESTGNLYYLPGNPRQPMDNVADREYFQAVMLHPSGFRHVGIPVVSRVSGTWRLPITKRMDRTYSDLEVINASVSLDELIKNFDSDRFWPSETVSLWRTDGILLLRSPEGASVIGKPSGEDSSFRKQISTGLRGLFHWDPASGKNSTTLVSYAQLADYPVTITVTASLQDALSAWQTESFQNTVLLLFLSLVALLFSGRLIEILRLQQSDAIKLDQYGDRLEGMLSERTAELVKTNGDLEQTRDEALAALQAKSVFLANMSHELRTPMNGVIGMTDLALRRATDPKQIDYLNKSNTAAKHMITVINDILDISKIEAECLSLEEANFSLAQVIDEVVSMLEAQAQIKSLSLSREIDQACPELLSGDAFRLRQILLNFIGNAIKFSDQGQITVRASTVEDNNHSILARIEITDQGIGISPEQQARLFSAFAQVDNSFTRKYGGTGLGLIISKRIAKLMGGDAGVISQEGIGSTFWFTARLKKCAKIPEDNPAADGHAEMIIRENYSGRRILVADDDPTNREIVQTLLESAGLVVDTAEDGAQAFTFAQEKAYDAIFMDMQMPGVNGLEATRLIRKIPGYSQTPIMAMTANAFAEDKARCFEAGMSEFLIKPFDPDTLFATLMRSLSRRNG